MDNPKTKRNLNSILRPWPLWVSITSLTGLAFVFLTILATPNLQNTAFWFDEAQQILISLGVSNQSPPWTPPIPTLDYVRQLNESLNLDPGGFTFLLNVWSQWVGPSTFWMRLLPFFFFLLCLPVCGWLGWQWSRSLMFSLICSTVPFLFPVLVHYSYEVRAYSFESLGVLVGVLLLNRLITTRLRRDYLVLGVFLSLFMTSRYGFLFIVAASSFSVLYLLIQEPLPKAEKIKRLALYTIPLLIITGLIFKYTYAGQSKIWLGVNSQNAPVIGQGPPHVQEFLLKNQSAQEILSTFQVNLFSWPMIPLTLFLIGFPLLGRTRFWKRVSSSTSRLQMFHSQISFLYFFFLSVFLMSVVSSVLGYYPWHIERRWSLYLVVLSLTCLLILLQVLWVFLDSTLNKTQWPWLQKMTRTISNEPFLQWSLLLLLLSFNTFQFIENRFQFQYDITPTLNYLHRHPSLTNRIEHHSVYVDYWDLTIVRYLAEFGDFKGLRGYPRIFVSGPLKASPYTSCIRYLVGNPWTNPVFQNELPHLQIEQIPFPGSRLYQVKQPLGSVCKR